VAPHATLIFAPGSYHLMCMQPTDAVQPGKTVQVTLKFADGASVTGDFDVRSATGN
jgi:copper(I)-binding protein